MKARAKDRRWFRRTPIQPNIRVIEPIRFTPDEISALGGDEHFWNQFEHADLFGSLIQPDAEQLVEAKAWLDEPVENTQSEGAAVETPDAFVADLLDRAQRVVDQATLLARQYAVVIANPPYLGSSAASSLLSTFLREQYPESKSDLFAAFIERNRALSQRYGLVAMVTMQSWMFLSSYEKLRAKLLRQNSILTMAHIGARGFDSIGGEVVSTTAFVLEVGAPDQRGSFLRLVDGMSEAEKTEAALLAIRSRATDDGFYTARSSDFAQVPGSPVVYWLSENMRAAFTKGKPLGKVADPRAGLGSGENTRFIRLWWEPPATKSNRSSTSCAEALESSDKWFPINKGGAFRKWFGNTDSVIAFDKPNYDALAVQGNRLPSRQFYFRDGVTWSKVSSGEPAFRYQPSGSVMDSAGNTVFVEIETLKFQILGIANSRLASGLLACISPTLNFEAGQIRQVPVISPDRGHAGLASTVATLVELARSDWDSYETSWDFAENPLIATARSAAD